MDEGIGKCDFVFTAGPSVVEPVIDCKMRCQGCGVKIQFPVIARRVGEDVVEWVKRAQQVAGQAHGTVRPGCTHTHCDLQIPLPEGSKGVGEAVKS